MTYVPNNLLTGKLLISLFLFSTMGIACTQSKQATSTIMKTAALTPLEVQAQKHYRTLAQLSVAPRAEFKELDLIKFPKEANKMILKTFRPAYLSMAEIKDLVSSLKHPANSSVQTRAELDFLLDLQKTRTEEQVAQALEWNEIVYFPIPGMKKQAHLFFEAYQIFGMEFNPKAYPNTKKLFQNIMKEMRHTEFTAKNKILRARPRQLESKLQPLKKMSSSSFASGHTLWAYLQAYLFAELIPSKREAFLELAYEIGFTREVLGVHYPSDEEAARKLAHDLLAKLWSKPEFKADFIQAKLEWNK